MYACADAMREEYKAIIDAGLSVQLDDPAIGENWDQQKNEPSVEGLPSFASIADIPGPVDRASLYLPPQVGLGLLDAINKKGVKELYVNPGAESDALMAEAERLGLETVYACSIVDIGERP